MPCGLLAIGSALFTFMYGFAAVFKSADVSRQLNIN